LPIQRACFRLEIMKIAIVGYGRMGKCIEQQAKNLGIEIGHIIDSTEELEQANFAPDEVVKLNIDRLQSSILNLL